MIWAAPGKTIQSRACTAFTVRRTRLTSVAVTAGIASKATPACGPQGRLVVIDRQDVVHAAVDDVRGGVALIMRGICVDDRTGDVHAVQQVAELV